MRDCLQDQEGYTALSLAVLEEESRVAELLLGHPGVNVDLSNKIGSSPLIIAARSGDAGHCQPAIKHRC